MFSLCQLFKKSPVKKLLGGGLILSDGQQQFYLDSNTDIGLTKKAVTIFRKEVRKVLNNDFKDLSESTQLTEREKNQITLKTKRILELEGFDVIISPDFPLEFSIKFA